MFFHYTGNNAFTRNWQIRVIKIQLYEYRHLIFEHYTAVQLDVSFKRSFTENVASTICLPFNISKTQADAAGRFYEFVGVNKTGKEWVVTMQAANVTTDNPLQANKPYLFMPGATGPVTFSCNIAAVPDYGYITAGQTIVGATDTNGQTVAGYQWEFKGTFEKQQWDDKNNQNEIGYIYGFAATAITAGEGGNAEQDAVAAGEFVKGISGAYVPGFRAYLKYASTSGARTRAPDNEVLPNRMTVRLIGKNDETDGISEIGFSTGEVNFDNNSWYDLNGHSLSEKPTKKGIYINGGKKVIIN